MQKLNESKRSYTWADGNKLEINNPTELSLEGERAMHVVKTAQGETFKIAPNWIHAKSEALEYKRVSANTLLQRYWTNLYQKTRDSLLKELQGKEISNNKKYFILILALDGVMATFEVDDLKEGEFHIRNFVKNYSGEHQCRCCLIDNASCSVQMEMLGFNTVSDGFFTLKHCY